MFAVGVNSSPSDFLQAVKRPQVISTGYVCQFIIKPLLGYIFGSVAVIAFHLPNSIGKQIARLWDIDGNKKVHLPAIQLMFYITWYIHHVVCRCWNYVNRMC